MRRKKNPEIEQGFDRFEPKLKKIVIGCFIVMFASCIEMLIMVFLSQKQLWYFIGMFFCTAALFVIWNIDNKDQKEHMDKYVDSYKKKLEILDGVLVAKFCINSKDKLEGLINIYQEYVDKKKEQEKKRIGFSLTIFSALGGVLVVSFENMGLIGIDFTSWIYLAAILLILGAVVGIWIYSYMLFDSAKRKYEIMIKDLKELMLIKYL